MSLSLYIHFPFCANLCGYCDFYKTTYHTEQEQIYLEALRTELRLAAYDIPTESRSLDTIYIGGGTPSLASFGFLGDLLDDINKYFRLSRDLEFSFEINPESLDSEKLLFLQKLGVNRPIFGIQSFNLRLLKTLDRKHKLEDSFRAVYLARALGFTNFGVDMIFGLPRQSAKLLSDDLNQVIALEPPHISYYQLTVEKGTPLEQKVTAGKLRLPDNDLMAAMYRGINEEMKKHGYFRYEVSSFARAGFECRHNLRYWEGGDFLGLGPSAHSFIGNRRFANLSDLRVYIAKLSKGERPLIFDTDSIDSRITEAIMLGLRTARGIEREHFARRFGVPVEKALREETLRALIDAGFIDPDTSHIRLTDTGLPLADEIIRRLIK